MKNQCIMCGKKFESKKSDMFIEINDVCDNESCLDAYNEAIEESFNSHSSEQVFLTEEDLNESH